MVDVTFYVNGDFYTGFLIKGHAGYGTEGNDIVCSAVSSAAYLTANNITDFFGINADVTASDGCMKLTSEDYANVSPHINGLCEHMLQLQEQYRKMIKVKISEV